MMIKLLSNKPSFIDPFLLLVTLSVTTFLLFISSPSSSSPFPHRHLSSAPNGITDEEPPNTTTKVIWISLTLLSCAIESTTGFGGAIVFWLFYQLLAFLPSIQPILPIYSARVLLLFQTSAQIAIIIQAKAWQNAHMPTVPICGFLTLAVAPVGVVLLTIVEQSLIKVVCGGLLAGYFGWKKYPVQSQGEEEVESKNVGDVGENGGDDGKTIQPKLSSISPSADSPSSPSTTSTPSSSSSSSSLLLPSIISGVFSGLFGGTLGIWGPPVIIFYHYLSTNGTLTKPQIRASGACIGFMNSLGRWSFVIIRELSDSSDTTLLTNFEILEVLVIVSAVLGCLVGFRVEKMVDVKRLAGVLDGLLGMCAVVLVIGGVVDL